LPVPLRRAFLDSLTPAQLEWLRHDWAFLRHDYQDPPDWQWYVWLMQWGRGAGKTWCGANWVIERARRGYGPIALVGETAADVRDVMIELGDSSIMRQSRPEFMPTYEPSKRRLTWPNGVVAIAYNGREPDQLRGPQHATAWVDELCKYRYPDESWSNLMFGLRLGDDPRAVVTTTPKPIELLKELRKAKTTAIAPPASTFANAANLSARTLDYLRERYAGTRVGLQELDGLLLEDDPNALWRRAEMIDAHRIAEAPADLARVVVAIDPAVTATDDSAETAIIVAGKRRLGERDHYYVLDDVSGRMSPADWAKRAISVYEQYKADRIVAEVNNGGDLVEATIKSVDRHVPYKKVVASRGKRTRAEPIAALYEQGLVHHVRSFGVLEGQMCTWVPGDEGQASPDRMDALVWALSELAGRTTHEPVSIGQPYFTGGR
jgi:predicted phage terminase large subunit-like protein